MPDCISIILPVYNVEKYLPKCIESIIAQTYNNLEIILVDDGSPDNCPKICDEYALKDNRIKVIHQKNSGVSAARNAGLDIASGEYIGFVDPDDFISPEMYEKMLSAIKENNANLCICGYDYVDEAGEVKTKYIDKPHIILTQKDYMEMWFDMPPTARHGVVNKLFKKDLIEDLRFPQNLKSSEDVYFITKYGKHTKKAVFIHKPLYKNTVRQGSATHGGLSIKSLAESFAAHKMMHNTAVNLYPELNNHSFAFLMDVCVLKYNEAKEKFKFLPLEEKSEAEKYLKQMHKFIKKNALKVIFNNEIYWKTRIYYIIL